MRVRPVRVERQLAHLLERRLADLLAVAVADVDREEPGERVEVALAVRVPEVAAVAPDDDRDVLAVAEAAHPGEVHPQVVPGELLEVGRGTDSALPGRHDRAAAIDDRCTSLSTTEPRIAPLIGFSPTVPTTIVLASSSLATAISTSAGRPSSMREVAVMPAASRSLTARATAREPSFSSWLLKSVDSPSTAGPPKALM